MGKDKRKGRESSNAFDYRYKSGDVGDMMRRYDIEGTTSTHPDMRGPGGKKDRDKKDVDRDIAKAMMNDYDTRRSMEAAAMAGDKDAKKFAKKGFKEGNIYSAYDTLKDLKKEYVGGGGMDGAKNRAGLTQALVKADRNNFIADNDAKYASKADLASMEEKMNEDPGQARQATEGKSFNDYMKGTFGSKYEEIARGPAPYTDGDQDGGTAIPSASESTSSETAASAAAQTNLADTVAALSDVGAAAKNKSKMGMYSLGSLGGI